MGRPKKNTAVNVPGSMALNPVASLSPIMPGAVEAITDRTFNITEVQAMVEA